MGFKNIFFHKVGVYTSDRVFDLDPVSALYLYCDVIEPRTVGHTLAPLLGVIPVEGKSGANVAKRYEKLQYYPVLKKIFQTYIFHFGMIKEMQSDFAREKLLSLYIFENRN